MKIVIRIYNKKNKLVARRMGGRDNWPKLYGKLASAVGHKWVIRVDYGYAENVFGERVMFKNEGVYYNVLEARRALAVFIEK